MNKYLQVLIASGIVLLGSWSLAGAVSTFAVQQGGTGTTTAPIGQLIYGGYSASTPDNRTYLSVATTSVGCSGATSCTSFTAIGGSPITITTTDTQGNWFTPGLGYNSTSTPIAFNNGVIISASSTISNLTYGKLLSINGSGVITASSTIGNGQLVNSSIVVTTASPLGGAATVALGGTLALTCTGCLTALPALSGAVTSNGSTAVTAFGSQSAGVLANAVTGIPTFQATSTLYGLAPAGGYVLGFTNGAIGWVATSSSASTVTGAALTKGNFLVGNDAGLSQATSTVFISSTGSIGISSTSPSALLSVMAGGSGFPSQALSTVFAVSSSTQGNATTTLFSIKSDGTLTTLLGTGAVSSASGVLSSGTLSIANGGTNATSQTTNGVAFYDGSKITTASNFTWLSGQLTLGQTGSATAPNLILADSGTGLFRPSSAANVIGFTTNSIEAMRITTNQQLGIGTSTPYSKLSVWGSNTTLGTRLFELTNNASTTLLAVDNSGVITIGTTTAGVLNVASSGLLYVGAAGGTGTVTSVAGANGILGTVTSSGLLSLSSYLATSSSETAGQIPYWTTTGGNPAKLGSVATSSLGVTGAITFSGTIGSQIGGASGNIGCTNANGLVTGCLLPADFLTFNGKLGTSTTLTQGALLYSSGGSTVASVATTTLSGSGVISVTAGAVVIGGSAITVSCATCGTGSVTSITAGVGLSGGAITTSGVISMKSYIATSTAEVSGNLPYWSSTSGTPATLASAGNLTWNNTTSLLTVTGNASTTQISASGALYLPTDKTSPTISGSCEIDTTNGQLQCGSAATTSVFDPRLRYSFGMMGTTSANTITGSTTAQAAPFPQAVTFTSVFCVTDVGTVDVKWVYGPTPTQIVYIVGASSTVGVYTLTTGNTPGINASSTVTIGKPASSPTSVACTATYTMAGT